MNARFTKQTPTTPGYYLYRQNGAIITVRLVKDVKSRRLIPSPIIPAEGTFSFLLPSAENLPGDWVPLTRDTFGDDSAIAATQRNEPPRTDLMPYAVAEFQKTVIGATPGDVTQNPDDDFIAWLVSALREEITELQKAHAEGTMPGRVDALLDLIYFSLGGLYRFGLTPEQTQACFLAVHETNMKKVRGKKSSRVFVESVGDAVKPEGVSPPEVKIADILGLKKNPPAPKPIKSRMELEHAIMSATLSMIAKGVPHAHEIAKDSLSLLSVENLSLLSVANPEQALPQEDI